MPSLSRLHEPASAALSIGAALLLAIVALPARAAEDPPSADEDAATGAPAAEQPAPAAPAAPAAAEPSAEAGEATAEAPAPPAVAPPPRTVALVLQPAKDTDPQRLRIFEALLRTQLGRLQGIRSVPPSPVPGEDPSARLVELVDQGYEQLGAKQYAAALAPFEEAVGSLSGYAGPVERLLMARLRKGLAVALVLAGRAEEGRAATHAALNVWREQEPLGWAWDVASYRAFSEVRKERQGLPTGGIFVTSEPAGAAVRIDGSERGFTPLELSNMGLGAHRVEVALDGYERSVQEATVKSNAKALARFTLTEAPYKADLDAKLAKLAKAIKSQKTATAALGELRATLGCDVLLVLRFSTDGLANDLYGWMVGAEGGATEVTGRIEANAAILDSARDFLGAALNAPAAAEPVPGKLDQPPSPGGEVASVLREEGVIETPEEPPPFWETMVDEWWFWPAVGVVAVGTGVGIYFLARDNGPDVRYGSLRVTIENGAQ